MFCDNDSNKNSNNVMKNEWMKYSWQAEQEIKEKYDDSYTF